MIKDTKSKLIKKLFNFGTGIITIGLVFWLLESAFFGFNLHPMTIQEAICDKIVGALEKGGFILIFIAMIMDFDRNINE